MTRKKKCNSELSSFVAAAEQVCLQPVLEHRQRRGRRNIAWQAIPHLCCSNRKGTTWAQQIDHATCPRLPKTRITPRATCVGNDRISIKRCSQLWLWCDCDQKYTGWQWRNFVPYLRRLVFTAILWVKLSYRAYVSYCDIAKMRFVSQSMTYGHCLDSILFE